MFSIRSRTLICVCSLVLFAGAAIAEDVYYYLPVRDLKITSGSWPKDLEPENRRSFSSRGSFEFLQPYAAGEKNEEIYINVIGDNGRNRWFPHRQFSQNIANTHIAIRAEKGKTVSGTLFVPSADNSGMESVGFEVPSSQEKQAQAKRSFLRVKQGHYEDLLAGNIPGAAWFRNVVDETKSERKALGDTSPATDTRRVRFNRDSQIQQSYSLFTGGRAISENLQLDRELPAAATAERTVALDTLEGITIAEIDWKPIVDGLKPEKDPLAKYIPADQHVLFFPTFNAMTRVIDEAKANGTPVLRLMDPRSEDALTHQRYETQLCIGLDEWSRVFGPAMIPSIAYTGSDPYLRTGSDVAVIFQAPLPLPIASKIALNQKQAKQKFPGVKEVTGKIAGIAYNGVVSADRKICSYRATVGKAVVVTNSLHQLKRIIKAYNGKIANIDGLDEYTFFRDRYKRTDASESGLLVVTDAAIRRWCGARWRIAASRRVQAGAVLAQLQAQNLDTLAKQKIAPKQLQTTGAAMDIGKVTLTDSGVHSSNYGTLEFLTPIAEMPIDKVTEQEARNYKRFRDNYQRRWRRFFDPIAVRFSVEENTIAMDVTVRPLIAASRYREIIRITGNSAISDETASRHPEAALQYIMALDAESETIRQIGSFASQMVPNMRLNLMDWLGDWATLYADKDPVWAEFEKVLEENGRPGINKFLEANIHRLPVAFELDISNYFKFTGFIVAVRAFIEQTAPGMMVWETVTYNDQPYVRISPSASMKENEEELQNIRIYYAITQKGFILTLNETLLKNYIDRGGNKTQDDAKPDRNPETPDGWLGKSVAIRAKSSAFAVIQALTNESFTDTLRRRSWGNIAILNEWHNRYDSRSPVDFHQRLWRTKLVCPGGGEYVWNEKFRTMESTVFGCPAQPKKDVEITSPLSTISDAEFGLTFEENGLRARAKLKRR